jgi:GNAT superfamily N-acetyltransferase
VDIIIHEAKESDLPVILQLYSQLGQDDGQTLSTEEARSLFARISRYPDYHLYLASLEEITVGTFALLIMDNLAHLGAKSAILEDVVVAEGFRNRGVGKRMIYYAHNLCWQKGCYKMAFTSNIKREDAHRFYESLGFAKHGFSFSFSYKPRSLHAG